MQRKSGFRAPKRRLTGLIAITVLVLMLALGGCAGRGAQRDNGAPTGATTTQQTTGTSQGSQGGGSSGGSNSSADQVESLDQQVQDISSSMNGASQDADNDYSSQDNETQP